MPCRYEAIHCVSWEAVTASDESPALSVGGTAYAPAICRAAYLCQEGGRKNRIIHTFSECILWAAYDGLPSLMGLPRGFVLASVTPAIEQGSACNHRNGGLLHGWSVWCCVTTLKVEDKLSSRTLRREVTVGHGVTWQPWRRSTVFTYDAPRSVMCGDT
jgi:hypothetical protein